MIRSKRKTVIRFFYFPAENLTDESKTTRITCRSFVWGKHPAAQRRDDTKGWTLASRCTEHTNNPTIKGAAAPAVNQPRWPERTDIPLMKKSGGTKWEGVVPLAKFFALFAWYHTAFSTLGTHYTPPSCAACLQNDTYRLFIRPFALPTAKTLAQHVLHSKSNCRTKFWKSRTMRATLCFFFLTTHDSPFIQATVH